MAAESADGNPVGDTQFHVVDVKEHRPLAPMAVLGQRTAPTLEGRLSRTPFARIWPTMAVLFVLISLGEISTVSLGVRWAVGFHALALVLMGTHAPLVRRLNAPLARLEVAMLPVPLIRIVSLTSPLAEFSYIQWFSILAVILYAGIVASIRLLKPDMKSLGIRLPARRHLPLEAGVALFGFVLGYIEWHILRPNSLIQTLDARNLAAPIIILFVSTGLMEELLFRGMLQRYAGEAMGWLPGIIFVSLLFAVLHTGWESWADVVFVGSVGLLYSFVVRRTGSLLGVAISHGITNTMLFLIMPTLRF
jgi:membrane protease YdiL (CAAX protease family)